LLARAGLDPKLRGNRDTGLFSSGRVFENEEKLFTFFRIGSRRYSFNGHFESTCCHPLLLFSREGDCLAAKLRPGNVHSADNLEELLLPEIERQQKLGKDVVFRAGTAFTKPEIYEALEARGVRYAIRIPANGRLERGIAELLTRPVERPSHKPVF